MILLGSLTLIQKRYNDEYQHELARGTALNTDNRSQYHEITYRN